MTLIGAVPKLRRSADTIRTTTEQPVLPYTGKDFSGEQMASAVAFMMSHDYPNWHEDASCGDKPQEWFFGGDEAPGRQRHRPTLSMSEVKRAKAVCNLCPVRQQCLDYALSNREEFGVWGGSTGRDRAKWWRQQEAQAS